MTTTVEEQVRTVDQHPAVLRHVQQLRDVQGKLERANANLESLIGTREAIRAAEHEAAVAAALGEAPVVLPADSTSLEQIEVDIVSVNREVAILSEALGRLDATGVAIRQQAMAEVRDQLQASINTIVASMMPHVEQLIGMNAELARLAQGSPDVLVPTPGLLPMWLEQARRVINR